jgi:hypothetical protein
LECPSITFFSLSDQLKMQRRNSWSGPFDLRLSVETAIPQRRRPNEVSADAIRSNLTPQTTSRTKVQQLTWRIVFWALVALLTALISAYVYQVLIADHPHVGRLFFSPPDTNLAITILSQVLCQLIQALFKDIFDVLRWQLASSERGVPIPTFLQLSGATKWIGVLTLITIKGSHYIWGLHR